MEKSGSVQNNVNLSIVCITESLIQSLVVDGRSLSTTKLAGPSEMDFKIIRTAMGLCAGRLHN